MAATSGKSYEVKFIGNTTGLTNAFKDIEKHGRALGNTFGGITQSISKSMISTGQSLTKNITVPLTGLAIVINKSIKDASNLQEAQSKVTAVFGDQAKEIFKWSKTTASSLGVSSRAALEAAGTYGNLFQAFGIGKVESAKMSMRLVELAADMASFNNVPIEDALTALRSGLSGETEPLKRFGVALNDIRLKQEAANLQIYNGVGPLSVAAKTQAAYALILRDTALQQGDVARTAGGLANQKKFLAAQVEDLSGSFGAVFMPILINVIGVIRNQVLPIIQKLIEAFKTLSPSAIVTGIQIGIFAAALGPAIIMVGYLIKMINALTTAFQFLIKRIVIIPLAILAVATTLMKATDTTLSWGEAFYLVIEGIVKNIVWMVNAFISGINFLIRASNFLISGLDSIGVAYQKLVKLITGNNSPLIHLAKDVKQITWNANGLTKGFANAYAGFKKFSDKLKEEQQNLSTIAAQAQALAESIDTPGGGGKGKSVGGASKSAGEKIAKFTEILMSANQVLTDAKTKFNDFATSVSTSITGMLSFSNAATSGGSFLANLTAQATKAAQFGSKIQTLLSMGLSESALSQVLAAGADAGTRIADEIIAGGASAVNQVNTLITATQTIAEAVGESAANQFYSAGVSAGQALVDGVKAALTSAGFSINAQGVIVNQRGIDQVNAAVAKARTKKSKGGTTITKDEKKSITSLAEALGVDVPALAAGGIVSKPTLALIGESGPEAVVPLSRNNMPTGNTINLTVNAGMGADGNQIGREIVDIIKRYERVSGPVFASA